MGCIYIIKNKINKYVYIGKTEYTADIRFKRHLQSVKHGSTKLYNEMRRIGVENFYVETLEQCDNSMLDEREKYWISEYNSFNNGYNSTSGGSSGSKTDTELISRMIADGKTKNEISLAVGIRKETLCTIHNFTNNISKNLSTNKKKKIDMYSTDYKFIKTFESVREAFNELNGSDIGNFYSRVKQSCEIDSIAFGYRWRKHGDSYDTFKNTLKHTEYRCKVCNKIINYKSELCINCYNSKRAEHIPDKETLQLLVSEYTYTEISKMYNVSITSVRKWCNKYEILKTKRIDTDGVICEELGLQFKTFKEAAVYLINNGVTSATNVNRLAYSLSEAKHKNKVYLNMHWK